MDAAFTQTVDWLAFTIPNGDRSAVEKQVGGDWVEIDAGFRGYPTAAISLDGEGGVGKLGTGAPRRPEEIHLDLSGGIVNKWPIERIKDVLLWIFSLGGHITRIDIALDDRKALVSVATVNEAVDAGKAVTRSERCRVIQNKSMRKAESHGQTLYLGSPQSQTQLRVYDKRLQLQQKGRADADEYGTRWELEFRKDRAQACAKALCNLPVEEWKEFLVGLLRSYVDFREVAREDTAWQKYRAPLLPWWEALTEGFKKCRLMVAKAQKTLEDVKDWFAKAMGPILAVLYFKGGEGFIEKVVNSGIDRWKLRHLALMKTKKWDHTYALRPA